MKNGKKVTNQDEELYLLNKYITYCNAKNQKISLIESPIVSVEQSQISEGQGIPDAIIEENSLRNWIEITTFSRCQKMRKQIGEMRNFTEKFKSQSIIPGIPVEEFKPLISGFYEAISKKISKNYCNFASLAKVKFQGNLLVVIVNNDPYLNKNEFDDLVEKVQDEHVLFSWDIHQSCFGKVILGAYILQNNGKCVWEFVTIADEKLLLTFKKRQEIKLSVLKSLTK